MSSEKFTVDEAMSAGWHLLGEHFWTYLRLASLAFLLMFLPDMAGFAIGFNSNFAYFGVVFILLGIVLKGLIPMGLIYIQIRMIEGFPVSSDDFWKPAKKYFAYVGATLIYLWVVGFGMLFFVVPGIIFGIMFQFYPYFIVEHKLGPIQALKASSAITDGAMWELLLLAILIAIIQGLAAFLFVFGVVPAQVFKQLTWTSVYRTLLNNTPPEKLPFPYNRDIFDRISGVQPVEAALSAQPIGYDSNTQDGVRIRAEEMHAAEAVRQVEPAGAIVPAEAIVTASPTESTETAEPAKLVDSIDHPESTESAESAKSLDSIDQVESNKPVDNTSGENDKTGNQF